MGREVSWMPVCGILNPFAASAPAWGKIAEVYPSVPEGAVLPSLKEIARKINLNIARYLGFWGTKKVPAAWQYLSMQI